MLSNGKFIVNGVDLTPLLKQYLENLTSEIERLTKAIAEHNVETVCLIGHKLAGTAGSYKLQTISELGRVLESAGEEWDLQALQSTLEQLETSRLKHLQQISV